MDYQEIRDLIANAKKKTPVHVYVRHRGELPLTANDDLKVFPTGAGTTILIGEWTEVEKALHQATSQIDYFHLDNDRRKSAIPMLDLKNINARIEPGAVIREKVEIGDRAIIM
ncbi:MAG TPA: 2,3,4,5-tetrahydropyridine-2,6-dicarboxylate N-acetyltransferase, partial [Longimicrobiales bacterium]